MKIMFFLIYRKFIMSKNLIKCGFCNTEYEMEAYKLPILCPNCTSVIEKVNNEKEMKDTIANDFDFFKELKKDSDIFVVQDNAPRYSVIKKISAGGMGEILLVKDNHLKREVVMKVIHKNISSKIMQDKFIIEAIITGRLEHPYIIPIYDFGKRKDGSHYLTMKYVDGKNFSQIIKELSSNKSNNEYTLKYRLEIFKKVCEAVSYAHSKDIIHRDLKPDNVMAGSFGEVFLLDWGIAKIRNMKEFLPEESNMDKNGTRFGDMVGTPSYMAPEQALGKLNEIDKQTDIYGLGAILYELLTYNPPFQAKSILSLIKKCQGEMPPYPNKNSLSQKISPYLSAIAWKCLSKNKKDRYKNVDELVKDIDNFLDNKPIIAKKENVLEKLLRASKDNIYVTFRVTAIVFFLAFLIFGFFTVNFGQNIQKHANQKSLVREIYINFEEGKNYYDKILLLSNEKDYKEILKMLQKQDFYWSYVLNLIEKIKNSEVNLNVKNQVLDIEENIYKLKYDYSKKFPNFSIESSKELEKKLKQD